MNTLQTIQKTPSSLSHEKPAPLFPLSKENPSRPSVRRAWKLYVREKSPTSAQMIILNLLLDRPLRYGFSPITNPEKLANGHKPWGGFEKALNDILFYSRETVWDLRSEQDADMSLFENADCKDFWKNKIKEMA